MYKYSGEKKIKGYCRMIIDGDNMIIGKGSGNAMMYIEKKPMVKIMT